MTIGELARRVGLRPSAIRYYEARGIVPPPRSGSEYRLYGSETVAVIRFVRRARELGFSLEQIRQLIDASRDDPPCVTCRELLHQHLVQVEEELRRLRALRNRLRRLARQATPPTINGAICPLLEDGVEPAKFHASD
jgi:MerR family mercuric resistance operon transcriptional regulator